MKQSACVQVKCHHLHSTTAPEVKHASYAATRDALAKECRAFKPEPFGEDDRMWAVRGESAMKRP